MRPATLLKETPTQMFPCEIYKVFKNAYFYKIFPMAGSKNIVLKSLNFNRSF